MVSVTTHSAQFGFSSVYSGFGLKNEPRNCMKILETHLKSLRSELSASNAINCVECNKLDSLLDCRLGKKQNRQLGCHGWTVDDFDVCIKILVPKLHSNVPLCYPFSRTWKFHEWLRIKFAKCHMVVIALELYTRPWWDHENEVVCDKEVLWRDYLDWTWSSCQLLTELDHHVNWSSIVGRLPPRSLSSRGVSIQKPSSRISQLSRRKTL